MRLGILGGTFDPIHLGHLRLAEEVGEEWGLEKVHLVPASVPPHKEGRQVSAFHHRFDMTRLAAGESPLLEASDVEGRREGPSYSIETLREFHRLFTKDLQLFFIVGMDAFLEIESWREYPKLFDYADFVVIHRPGVACGELKPFLFSLGVGFTAQEDRDVFAVPSGHRLFYREATLMDISSTTIRRNVAAGKSIRFMVPEAVRVYIMEKGLYQDHGLPG